MKWVDKKIFNLSFLESEIPEKNLSHKWVGKKISLGTDDRSPFTKFYLVKGPRSRLSLISRKPNVQMLPRVRFVSGPPRIWTFGSGHTGKKIPLGTNFDGAPKKTFWAPTIGVPLLSFT